MQVQIESKASRSLLVDRSTNSSLFPDKRFSRSGSWQIGMTPVFPDCIDRASFPLVIVSRPSRYHSRACTRIRVASDLSSAVRATEVHSFVMFSRYFTDSLFSFFSTPSLTLTYFAPVLYAWPWSRHDLR
jgi:hypothetical protein